MNSSAQRAALYARVSSHSQQKHASIESQLAELRERARQDGVRLLEEHIVIDDGHSGSYLDRPGVFIRPVTLEEQGKLADLGAEHEKSSAAIRIRHCTLSLLQWTVCDEEGKPLFTGEDLAGLMSKSSASAFLRLQNAVLKFSGLTEESRRELEKNLLIEQTGGPGSD